MHDFVVSISKRAIQLHSQLKNNNVKKDPQDKSLNFKQINWNRAEFFRSLDTERMYEPPRTHEILITGRNVTNL